MRLTLSDRYDQQIGSFEVVLEGPPDTYYKDKPRAESDPHYQLGTEEGRKSLMEALVTMVEKRSKQDRCNHKNSKRLYSRPAGSYSVTYFECLDCEKVFDDD